MKDLESRVRVLVAHHEVAVVARGGAQLERDALVLVQADQLQACHWGVWGATTPSTPTTSTRTSTTRHHPDSTFPPPSTTHRQQPPITNPPPTHYANPLRQPTHPLLPRHSHSVALPRRSSLDVRPSLGFNVHAYIFFGFDDNYNMEFVYLRDHQRSWLIVITCGA